MTSALYDLRHAARSLWRAPAFTLIAVTTLAIGIGASVSAYVYLDYLKRPTMEAPRPEQLRFVYQASAADPRGGFSLPDLRDLQTSASLHPLVAWRLFSTSLVSGDTTRHAWGHAVSGEYFNLFGAQPALGRLIQPEDDREGAEPVLVLGHRFWTQRLGADPGIVGKRVSLDGVHPYVVVGVSAPRFQGEGFGTAIYLPLGSATWLPGISNRDAANLSVLGRMPEATSPAEAEARLAALARSMDAANPGEEPRRFDLVTPSVAQAWDPLDPLVRGAETLAVTVAVLLLLGAANVATLVLARATTRQREWAVRSALGASRGALARATLIESGVLAALGVAFGLPLAVMILQIVEGYLVGTAPVGLGDWSAASHLPLNWTLAGSLAVCLAFGISALCWGLSIAMQTRTDIVPSLKAEGEAGGASGSLRVGGRRALVVSQAALSTALLVVAAFASRSFGYLGSQALGFPTDNRLLAVVHRPAAAPSSPSAPGVASESLLDELRALPGVRAAGLVSRGPIHPLLPTASVETAPGGNRLAVTFNNVSDGYLDALGVPLLDGRDFRPEDRSDSARIALISQALAQSLWPGSSAVGRRLRLIVGGNPAVDLEIVGMAADSRQGDLRGATPPHVFLPRRLGEETRPTFVIHANAPIAEGLARLLRERHPESALIDLQPLEEQRRRVSADGRMNAEIATGMGMFGLLLAGVGVFGLVSFSVSRRFREFGIRLALGATGVDLLRGVMGDTSRLLGIGVLAGLGLAYPIAQVVESRLMGVSATDPWSYALAAGLLFGVGLTAAYAAARRAFFSEPLAALRRS